jgi:hypothetical protein
MMTFTVTLQRCNNSKAGIFAEGSKREVVFNFSTRLAENWCDLGAKWRDIYESRQFYGAIIRIAPIKMAH